ncbi:MAG TPA: alpha/beta fold hydrolase [Gemmatimonadaceae bacterium]|nr:alpha/beta fold hydrolase [Gemmatimonadaceae bacterium]
MNAPTSAPARSSGRWNALLRTARVLAVIWLAKLALTAGLYGLTRAMDIEKRTITDTTRDSVRAAGGGSFVRLRDGVTHYEIAGPDSAPLVVLAAGASVPGYIWQPTFDTLRASGYRVLRYDYFGRGWSDRPRIPLAQDVYVRQLDELLDSLHVTTPITLAGLSYGGTVITSYAAARPDRVGALVYMDPAIHTPREIPWYIRWDVVGNFVYQWQSRHWAQGQLDDFLHPGKFPDWPARYVPQMTYKGFRRGRLSDAEANADFDQRPQLAEVGKNPRPVLVVWGRQDRTVPFARSADVLAALPRATFAPIDSSGHLPLWEQPAATHTAVLTFLRAHAAHP